MGSRGRDRGHHALERPPDAGHLAGRPGAGGRERRGPQAPEWAPLTASLLADILHDAGLPDGAFNVVQGIGEEAGAALVAHPGVDRVAFTGSVPTGRLVAAAAGANLTPVSLELGGKSPFIAFADADLDAVVAQAVDQFDNAGQVCLAGTRLLVEAPIHDEFLERFTEATAAIRAGRSARAPRPTSARSSRASTSSAWTASCSGRRPTARARCSAAGRTRTWAGCYYRPTLFVDAPPGAEILTRGGVRARADAAVLRRRGRGRRAGERHRLRSGRHPLHRRSRRARSASRARLVAGTVWVNCFFVRDLARTVRRLRNSGMGREGGTWSFDFYADVKNVCTAPWN